MKRILLPLLLLPLLAPLPAAGRGPALAGRFEAIVADTDADLWCVRMLPGKTIYLCGDYGTFVTSTDGGKTWAAKEILHEARLRVMAWHDARTGFLAGRKGTVNVMLRTTDGGQTFTEGGADLDFPVTGFAFTGARSGWLVAGSGKEKDGAWRRTMDGGITFRPPEASEFRLPSRALRSATAAGDKRIFAVGSHVESAFVGDAARSPLYQTRRGGVLRSDDGGRTWVVRDAGNRPGTSLWGVDFLDADHGWVVGDNGFAARTADGGETWTAAETGVKARLRAVDAVDADTAIAVGDEGTAVGTNDGGKTMVVLKTPSMAPLRDVSFLDGTTGLAVGPDGAVLRFVREW